MSKGLKYALLALAAAIVATGIALYFSRRFWIARIKAKWSERFAFLLGADAVIGGALFSGYDDRRWASYKLSELRYMYWNGLPYWFETGTLAGDTPTGQSDTPTNSQKMRAVAPKGLTRTITRGTALAN